MSVPIGSLVNVAIEQLPAILTWLRNRHEAANPGAAAPTDEEMAAALKSAVESSIARDDAWLAAHPPTTG